MATTVSNQKHLQDFIYGLNIWAAVTKTRLYDAKKLTQGDVDELILKVESELSPENLTCDGELSGNTLKLKTAKLNGAKAQLIKLTK